MTGHSRRHDGERGAGDRDQHARQDLTSQRRAEATALRRWVEAELRRHPGGARGVRRELEQMVREGRITRDIAQLAACALPRDQVDSGVAGVSTAALDHLRSHLAQRPSGSPPPADLRRDVEAATGRPIGSARIHADAAAHDLARRLGAQAFTVGDDVFLGARTSDTSSPEARGVLAHELSHTAQAGGRPALEAGFRVVSPAHPLEREAASFTVSPGTLHHAGSAGEQLVLRVPELPAALATTWEGLPHDPDTQQMMRVLPAIAHILSAMEGVTERPGSTDPRHPSYWAATAAPTRAPAGGEERQAPPEAGWAGPMERQYLLGLWDLWKALWESPDRATRTRWLDAALGSTRLRPIIRTFGGILPRSLAREHRRGWRDVQVLYRSEVALRLSSLRRRPDGYSPLSADRTPAGGAAAARPGSRAPAGAEALSEALEAAYDGLEASAATHQMMRVLPAIAHILSVLPGVQARPASGDPRHPDTWGRQAAPASPEVAPDTAAPPLQPWMVPIDRQYVLALWDLWKAIWESPDRDTRRQHHDLATGETRLGPLLTQFEHTAPADRRQFGAAWRRVRTLYASTIRSPLRQLRNRPTGWTPIPAVATRPVRRRGRGRTLTEAQVVNPAYAIPGDDPSSPVTLEEVRASRGEIAIRRRPAESILWVRQEIVSLVGESRYTLMAPLITGRGSGLLFGRHTANAALHASQVERDELRAAAEAREQEGGEEGETAPRARRGPSPEAQQARLHELDENVIPQQTERLREIDAQVQAAAPAVATRVLEEYRRTRETLLAAWAQHNHGETLTPFNPESLPTDRATRLDRLLLGRAGTFSRNHRRDEARALLFRLDGAIATLAAAEPAPEAPEGAPPATEGAAPPAMHPLLREVERSAIEASLTYSPGATISLDPVQATGLLDRPEGIFEGGGGGYREGLIDETVDELIAAGREGGGEGPGTLPPAYRNIARDILHALESLEGAPTSMNTWDSADITAGSGLAARGVLQNTLLAFHRSDPAGFRQLFGRYGVEAYSASGNGQLSVMVPEATRVGTHDVAAGTVLRGEQAIQYIIRDPVILAQFRRAGHATSYQRSLIRGTLGSITQALDATYQGVAWRTILQGLDEEVAGQAVNAIATAVHGSGGPDGRGGVHSVIRAACPDADLSTVEGRTQVARAAGEWLLRNLAHRARGYLAARAERMAQQAPAAEAGGEPGGS